MTREEKIQIAAIITTIIVVFVIIVAIIVLVRYAEEIKSNPIDYAIKNTDIVSCVCSNDAGQTARFGEYNPFSVLDNNTG